MSACSLQVPDKVYTRTEGLLDPLVQGGVVLPSISRVFHRTVLYVYRGWVSTVVSAPLLNVINFPIFVQESQGRI